MTEKFVEEVLRLWMEEKNVKGEVQIEREVINDDGRPKYGNAGLAG